jgi:hypothetical protein
MKYDIGLIQIALEAFVLDSENDLSRSDSPCDKRKRIEGSGGKFFIRFFTEFGR